MTATWLKRAAVLAVCIAFSCHWALSSRGDKPGVITDVDYAQIYYGVQCLIHHQDPYDGVSVLRAFDASGLTFTAKPPADPKIDRIVMTQAVYLPTGFFALAPFALAPWAIAHTIWLWLMAGLLVLAALLIWDLAGDASPVTGWLLAFMLLNCMFVLLVGNPAGITVPLCIIAAWCFLKERLELLGVALLAVSLVVKPQDAGFVWLYFLLAGGSGRKRAWQTLAVTALLVIGAVVWIAPIAPHWLPELGRNLHLELAPGGINNPNPFTRLGAGFDPVISMRNTLRLFRNAPGFYGPGALIGIGLSVLAWVVVVARKRPSSRGILLALAATSALSMLPSYHRNHDAKLLMLMIPACALLWAGGGARRWVALGITLGAIFATSDVPVIAGIVALGILRPTTATVGGKLLFLAVQPAPLVLLAAGCFYLCVYLRCRPDNRAEEAAGSKVAAAATV